MWTAPITRCFLSGFFKGTVSTDSDAHLQEISVQPALSTLNKGDSTNLLVTAHYDNGETRDVTPWAKFTSTDEGIAEVDSTGQVKVQDSGHDAILVWFGSKVNLARIIVPYPNQLLPLSLMKLLNATSSIKSIWINSENYKYRRRHAVMTPLSCDVQHSTPSVASPSQRSGRHSLRCPKINGGIG